MSYTDIQTLLNPTLQFLLKNYPNWTRCGISQLTLEGEIQHTSWLYEYVTSDDTHKITIQHHKDTDSYDVGILGHSWINTYQGFTNFKYERHAIVYVLKAILEVNNEISSLNEDQRLVLEKIIEGHLENENWNINLVFV